MSIHRVMFMNNIYTLTQRWDDRPRDARLLTYSCSDTWL